MLGTRGEQLTGRYLFSSMNPKASSGAGLGRNSSPAARNRGELRRAIAGATEVRLTRFFRLRIRGDEGYLVEVLMARLDALVVCSF